MLAYLGFEKSFKLHKDASGQGLGCALYQKQGGKLGILTFGVSWSRILEYSK